MSPNLKPTPDLQCIQCGCCLNRNTKVRSDPNAWIGKSERTIREDGQIKGKDTLDITQIKDFKFTFQTTVKMCRKCFWVFVQTIADKELIGLMTPADFE